jgi:hypothetical protein
VFERFPPKPELLVLPCCAMATVDVERIDHATSLTKTATNGFK